MFTKDRISEEQIPKSKELRICPDGFKLKNNQCVHPVCADDYIWQNNECVAKPNKRVCN